MMENWAGSKSEWTGEISWKTMDDIDWSMLEYHWMLFYPI